MRILLLVLWMLIPVGAFAYHLGPGQSDMKCDKVAELLKDADNFVLEAKRECTPEEAKDSWAEAEALYKEALQLLPEKSVATQRRARLELAKCQLNNSGLPSANEDLKVLVNELMEDKDADPSLLADARMTLANSQYYITWLMRLEGRTESDWEPEITSSQQLYRLLAEEAEAAGDEQLISTRKSDLESSVKLARMEIGQLQGLPLPSQ
ncbi:MAG: hypothetical protein AB8B55_08665 [Mariniblastus sp.]